MSALPPRGAARRPCRLCGYHAPNEACPHCGHAPVERSLALPAPGPLTEIWAGAGALPRGALFLLRDPRSIAILSVPVALTVIAFAAATAWLVSVVDSTIVEGTREVQIDDSVPDWLARILTWPLEYGLATLAAEAVGVVLTLLLAAVAFWFSFSIVFETVAGPFLDEVHGRVESRWFGSDPRSRLERPAGASTRLAVRASWLAIALGLPLAVWVWSATTGAAGLLLSLAGLGAPALGIAALRPAYGRWLRWVAGIELRALRSSLLGLALTGGMLAVALPLLLIPVLGHYLYGAAAGFATSLALLDIPFGRRGLGTAARVAFLRRHILATTVYGTVSGLLFGVPFVGPLLVVPSASVGGLWLFCRLDKEHLRRTP